MSKRDSLSKEVYSVSEIPFMKERKIRICVYNKKRICLKERRGREEERKEKRRGYVLSLQKTSTNVEGMIQLEKLHL